VKHLIRQSLSATRRICEFRPQPVFPIRERAFRVVIGQYVGFSTSSTFSGEEKCQQEDIVRVGDRKGHNGPRQQVFSGHHKMFTAPAPSRMIVEKAMKD
jgi:hypothetical protein